MMNRNYVLTPQQMQHARSLFRDPVLFARCVLGVNLWEREVEILRSVETHRRTAVKAAHGLGKTFTLAVVSLWWLARHHEGIVLTTSPTLRQVKTQLWAEIHRLVGRARIPYPELNQTADRVSKAVRIEETRFAHTMDVGLEKLETLLKGSVWNNYSRWIRLPAPWREVRCI